MGYTPPPPQPDARPNASKPGIDNYNDAIGTVAIVTLVLAGIIVIGFIVYAYGLI